MLFQFAAKRNATRFPALYSQSSGLLLCVDKLTKHKKKHGNEILPGTTASRIDIERKKKILSE